MVQRKERKLNAPRYQPPKTGFLALSIVFAIPAGMFVTGIVMAVFGMAA